MCTVPNLIYMIDPWIFHLCLTSGIWECPFFQIVGKVSCLNNDNCKTVTSQRALRGWCFLWASFLYHSEFFEPEDSNRTIFVSRSLQIQIFSNAAFSQQLQITIANVDLVLIICQALCFPTASLLWVSHKSDSHRLMIFSFYNPYKFWWSWTLRLLSMPIKQKAI